MKGRPPGTPKSTDPTKKKRKRVARERNLCDVKIKITEYFPGARQLMAQTQSTIDQSQTDSFFVPDGPFDTPGQAQAFADLVSGPTTTEAPLPGADGSRFYSIQRVNGTSAHGENEEFAGGHKHDLAESDRVKKNSIIRDILKDEKEKKKIRVSNSFLFHILASMEFCIPQTNCLNEASSIFQMIPALCQTSALQMRPDPTLNLSMNIPPACSESGGFG